MVSHTAIESEGCVLKHIKLHLKRYRPLVACYRLLKSGAIASDWWYTRFSKRRKAVLTPSGFKLVSRNYAENPATALPTGRKKWISSAKQSAIARSPWSARKSSAYLNISAEQPNATARSITPRAGWPA